MMWNWYFPVEIIGEKYRFFIFIYLYFYLFRFYIINYFRLRWFRINFLLSCNLLYKNKIIYFRNSNYFIKSIRRYLLLIIGLITYYGRWNLSFYNINEFIIIFILLTAFTNNAQSASFFNLITNSNTGSNSCFVFSSFINFGYS